MPFVSASETPEQKAARKAAKASMDPAAKVARAPLFLRHWRRAAFPIPRPHTVFFYVIFAAKLLVLSPIVLLQAAAKAEKEKLKALESSKADKAKGAGGEAKEKKEKKEKK
jgi:hypothetical protein